MNKKMMENCCSSMQSLSSLSSTTVEASFIKNPYNRKISTLPIIRSSSNSSPSDNSSMNFSPTNSFTNLSSKSSSSSLKDTEIPTPIISIEEISSENPCLACQSPCSNHPSYPSNLDINHEAELYGTVQPHTRHVIVSTGKSDWDRVIELASGSLSAELYKLQKNPKKEDRTLITNSSRQNSTLPWLTFLSFFGHDVLIYPDNLIVRNVSAGKSKEFYDQFLSNERLDKEKIKTGEISFSTEKIPYKAVILICGHKRRDMRCGVAGPILKSEFEKVLKEKRMDLNSIGNQGVPVYLTSHIGGHQFAGNVIVYQNGHGVWYGRVTPCHVRMIIDNTVIGGKIIKELHRGSMFGGEKHQASLDW